MKLLRDLADGIIVYVIFFTTIGVVWVLIELLRLFIRFMTGDY